MKSAFPPEEDMQRETLSRCVMMLRSPYTVMRHVLIEVLSDFSFMSVSTSQFKYMFIFCRICFVSLFKSSFVFIKKCMFGTFIYLS